MVGSLNVVNYYCQRLLSLIPVSKDSAHIGSLLVNCGGGYRLCRLVGRLLEGYQTARTLGEARKSHRSGRLRNHHIFLQIALRCGDCGR